MTLIVASMVIEKRNNGIMTVCLFNIYKYEMIGGFQESDANYQKAKNRYEKKIEEREKIRKNKELHGYEIDKQQEDKRK